MTTVIVLVVVLLIGAHLGAGHTHHRYRKAHGLDPHIFWSLGRGPYCTVRLPGGFRLGHKV